MVYTREPNTAQDEQIEALCAALDGLISELDSFVGDFEQYDRAMEEAEQDTLKIGPYLIRYDGCQRVFVFIPPRKATEPLQDLLKDAELKLREDPRV